MDLSSTGALRKGLSSIAIAATVPYLTLKLLWLCGSTVGFTDPATADDSTLWVLNLATFGMDAAALLLALAMVRPWGLRVPAGLLAFPMWVATGLLGTLLAAVPLSLLVDLLLGPEHPSGQASSEWVRPWVYVLVYGGFAIQGIALLTGFALYVRERWSGLLRSRIAELPRTGTLTLQRVLACAAALLTVPALAAHLYWAFGGQAGLPGFYAAEASRGPRIIEGVSAIMAVVACAAIGVVVFRLMAHRRLLVPLVAGWFAAGSVFAWGAWIFVAHSVSLRVEDHNHVMPPISYLVNATQAGAGLLMLVVGALVLIEQASVVADVESVR